jgi:hypothetical protein
MNIRLEYDAAVKAAEKAAKASAAEAAPAVEETATDAE